MTKHLTPAQEAGIRSCVAHYPHPKASVIDALLLVQSENRYISDQVLGEIASIIGISAAELDELATVYNLIFRKPVGKNTILLCDSVTCWLMGRDKIATAVTERLHIKEGQTTMDQNFTFLPIVCLGHCDHAPALLIGDQLHGDVTPASINALVDQIEGKI